MKNRIKYLILSLFMVVTLALCACGKKSTAENELPEQLSNQLLSQAESLLKQLYEMDDIQLFQAIGSVEQNGQNAFAEGIKSFQATKDTVGDLVSIDNTNVSDIIVKLL